MTVLTMAVLTKAPLRSYHATLKFAAVKALVFATPLQRALLNYMFGVAGRGGSTSLLLRRRRCCCCCSCAPFLPPSCPCCPVITTLGVMPPAMQGQMTRPRTSYDAGVTFERSESTHPSSIPAHRTHSTGLWRSGRRHLENCL